eukprot:GEMP01090395.1.p1 GENE.GEMP01090395.1~~GEMP01090395.1.p1  ORF type:complete len:125 (-),score=11.90 GEMP01090395.1:237-611(-)
MLSTVERLTEIDGVSPSRFPSSRWLTIGMSWSSKGGKSFCISYTSNIASDTVSTMPLPSLGRRSAYALPPCTNSASGKPGGVSLNFCAWTHAVIEAKSPAVLGVSSSVSVVHLSFMYSVPSRYS